MVFAGVLAVICWVAVFFALILVMVLIAVATAGPETPSELLDWLAAGWHGVSVTIATLLAARVLRRRGVDRGWWLVGLSIAELAIAAPSASAVSVGMAVLQSTVGVGGSIAAVTLWAPARRERRN